METHGATLNIALMQTRLLWEDPEANMAHFEGLMGRLTTKVDLVVLPEMFTTGFTMRPDQLEPEHGYLALSWMKQRAAQLDSAIMGSIAFKEESAHFNRLFFVEPNGRVTQYDKRHTFTLAGEHRKYTKGKKRVLVSFKGFTICPLICYDLRFPVWSRNTEDYDILIYVANWPALRIKAWDTLLQARAIENMAYVIGVNRCGTDPNGHIYPGHSAVYNALGDQLLFSDQEEVLLATLAKDKLKETRKKLGFLKDRDHFAIDPSHM